MWTVILSPLGRLMGWPCRDSSLQVVAAGIVSSSRVCWCVWRAEYGIQRPRALILVSASIQADAAVRECLQLSFQFCQV